ncbi:MAG: hypothetical protein IPI50_14930 [Saprospiraceae bacterium]|nr:hypothetical protein [Saprospiraceae bacterium]
MEQINKHNIRLGLQIEVDKKISDYLFTFNFNNQSNIINNPSNIDNYYSLYIKEDQNSIKLNKDIVKAKKQSEKGSNSILNILAIGGIAGLLIFSLIAL